MADTTKIKAPLEALDDRLLEAVSGGMSLYDGADGLDRDSWFVSLVRKMMTDGGAYPQQNRDARSGAVPLTTIIVGDYSQR